MRPLLLLLPSSAIWLIRRLSASVNRSPFRVPIDGTKVPSAPTAPPIKVCATSRARQGNLTWFSCAGQSWAKILRAASERESHAPKSCADRMPGMSGVADGFSRCRAGSRSAKYKCLQDEVCLRKVRPPGRLHRLGQFGGVGLPVLLQPFI